ncbi:MAG: nitronate monooxygenase [Bacteroidota bacterium]|nr:nitronate monooxygenase [Bacteroidota bacterium]MDP4233680.1 nitronate monooxygenase [Bacteroidota bacterium]MDP4241863.1 nitronate monooxygenase [Bacteroidota bacterium]MDP4288949.1 nitronate monooxygenase [Bacteroidota bacterium]
MNTAGTHPPIIQGGMGVAISGWRLARAVSRQGQLGVVSGTVLNVVFAQRLQDGDIGGHLRRALAKFPVPAIAERILKQHFNKQRSTGRRAVHSVPMFTLAAGAELLALTIAANFCEVYLAKEGHTGVVGINLLEKVQLPNLASLYGAMLADVDYVLMGAGIPREIPGILDRLANHETTTMRIQVDGAASSDEETRMSLDPKAVLGMTLPPLRRPNFLAIVSSDVLAQMLVQKANGRIDGFVIENALAGGHNAPPRGPLRLTESGEPVYGPRDAANLEKFRELGLPFWLAGDYGTPTALQEALAAGATGVQIGTPFAFCEESGLEETLKRQTLEQVANGNAQVFTDPAASPTGFPFKIVQLEETLSDNELYGERPRLCQLGFLRSTYKRPDGTIGYRCPGEPVNSYVKKGGKAEDTVGRKCLCNALMANVGLAQEQLSGYVEQGLVTAGDSLHRVGHFLQNGERSYTAAEVIEYLFSDTKANHVIHAPAVMAAG